jgi:DNA-binding transcriptional MerR regulator
MAEQHMQIGEVAQRTGLSLRTIRYYEEMRIVVPSARTQGGFRLYTDSDVERLEIVKCMKPLDFSLEETAELLATLDALETEGGREDLVATLRGFQEAAEERVAAVRARLVVAEGFAADLRSRVEGHDGVRRDEPSARG